jgi:S-phase kinase-associated protein 1
MDSIALISEDNHKIELDFKSAQKSKVLKQKLMEVKNSRSKGIPEIKLKDIKYDILKKIVEYLNYYKNKTPKEIPKPVPSESLSAFLDDWDFEFITNIDLDSTFDLMNAASSLQIQGLLDLASIKVASILKNKGIEDIRSMFKEGNNLSEKELKEYAELQNL